MLALETAPDLISTDRVAAAILVLGAGLYGLIQAKKKEGAPAPSCSCTAEILASEERVKKHVDGSQVEILNQLDATHKHARLLPEVQTKVVVLAATMENMERHVTEKLHVVTAISENVAVLRDRIKNRGE